MNSSEKLYKIYQYYEVKIDVNMNVEDKILITLCAYKDQYKWDGQGQFYGSGYWMDEAIDHLYNSIYNKKTAE